jgi:hypothetical protein
MKLKLDENGNAVLSDGKPVYIHDDGKEVAFDAPGTVATITRLNGEAKSHRERAEAAEKTLKTFEGLDDPAAARKALETIKSLDQKKLIDAGEVEKVKAEITKAYDEKLTAAEKRAADLEGTLYAEKIGGSFARSKFLADKVAVPADLVRAQFGSAFKIEDGRIAAYDANGNKVYSRAKPGELADFDEALEMLIDQYPHRDAILKGNDNGGAGARNGTGGTGAAKTITRDAFMKMDPAAQQNAVTKDGYTVTD